MNNHPLHGRVDVGPRLRGRGRRRIARRVRAIGCAASRERRGASKHLEQHQAQRVEIAADRRPSSSELLGGHVGWRARNVVVLDLLGKVGETEVHDLRRAAAVEHHVGGFQVAVKHPEVVRGSETGTELTRRLDGLVRGQAADAAEQRREILAVDVLHRQEMLSVGLAQVINPADVRVRDLTRDANLVVEPGQRRRLGRHRTGQELERHRLRQLQVVGAVDLAHSAATEETDDPVAADEDRACDSGVIAQGQRRPRDDVAGTGDRLHRRRQQPCAAGIAECRHIGNGVSACRATHGDAG